MWKGYLINLSSSEVHNDTSNDEFIKRLRDGDSGIVQYWRLLIDRADFVVFIGSRKGDARLVINKKED